MVEAAYEAEAARAASQRADGGVTLCGSMQCPFYVHRALKRLLRIEDSQLAVIQVVTGGGFGGKEDFPSIIAGHAALLARKSGRPVKMIYQREEDVAATTKRHPAVMTYRTAVARDGELLACEIDVIMDGGAYVTLSPVVASRRVLHAEGAYRWKLASIECQVVQTHTPPNGAFRGFGVPQTIFAVEAHLERIAHGLGLDPLEVRRRNLLRLGDVLPAGQVLRSSVSAREVLDAAAARSSYSVKQAEFLADQGVKRRGIGLSLGRHLRGLFGRRDDGNRRGPRHSSPTREGPDRRWNRVGAGVPRP
jgi:CO/xanthine dehydrogenase Mo-binding subunit